MTAPTFNVAAQAARAAEVAASRAGVQVSEVEEMAAMRGVSLLLETVWGRSPEGVPLNSELLRSVAHAGGSVTVARDQAGELAGAAALVCSPGDSTYSLIAAARAGGHDRGIGHALKLRQRQWALERGMHTMRWTFDPLVSRNARFNLTKLGAVTRDYQEQFYGRMSDDINGDDEADRLVAVWRLDAPRTVAASEGTAPEPVGPDPDTATVLSVGPDGAPMHVACGEVTWCRVPEDVVQLRHGRSADGLTLAAGRSRRAHHVLRLGSPRDRGDPKRLVPPHEGGNGMKIEHLELRSVRMPLVAPFRTSFGTSFDRETFLLRVVTQDAEGWAECGAEPDPLYSAEFLGAAEIVLREQLVPRVQALGDRLGAERVKTALEPVKGHPMAKHVLETAILDAELRTHGLSFGRYLGAVRERVPAGVSVGIMDSVPELLDAVGGYLDEGYLRIKLKIEPGWDVEPVRSVRERYGDDVLLQVDANTAYSLADARHLAKLDPFDLLLIEQPLREDDLRGHAELARLLATPVCLDESITSARDAATAIAMGACSIINVKPARVGGYLEARRIHDVAEANGVPVWCGGMLETGIGRAPNVALAALPGFVLPGDTSASSRYYQQDLTTPFELVDGHLDVPQGPGIGVEVLHDVLDSFTVSTTSIAI